MASAISRAREQALSGGGSGEYLDNNTLIDNLLVFGIIDVVDDRGGGFNGNDRWIVKVEPFYDGEQDPAGLITLTDNPARRKFMNALAQELDDLEKKNEDAFIGPCVMVKLKGKNYRYIEIVDFDTDTNKPIYPPGAVPAAAKVEEEMRPRRPRSGSAPTEATAADPGASTQRASSSAPAEVARPNFAEAVEAKADASPARDESAPRRTRSRRTAEESDRASEFPPIKIWAKAHNFEVPEGRGRPKTEVKLAYEKAKAEFEGATDGEDAVVQLDQQAPSRSRQRRAAAQDKPYQGSSREVEEELAARAAESARTHSAQIPVGAPSRDVRPPASGGQTAQELTWKPGMPGVSIEPCPSCNEHPRDRIFPTGEEGQYGLVHLCAATGEQKMMEAVPVTDQESG